MDNVEKKLIAQLMSEIYDFNEKLLPEHKVNIPKMPLDEKNTGQWMIDFSDEIIKKHKRFIKDTKTCQ